ncbi:hypothetical protein BD413DRAFT_613484 [Trametes elegans]|nr:hypothetical protein BD413DRAFT_613484 [Trametes elegans]
MFDGPHTNRSSTPRCVAVAVPALLDPSLLQDELTIGAAIRALETYLVSPTTRLQDAVEELLSVQAHCLEFTLSGKFSHASSMSHVSLLTISLPAVSDEVYDLLNRDILHHYPHHAEPFLNSLASRLLKRFSLYLHFLPYEDSSDAPPSLRRNRRDVEVADLVLQAVSKFHFNDDPRMGEEENVDLGEFADSHILVKKKGKHKRKESKPTVPATKEEANVLASNIIGTQMDILMDYLDMFRLPKLAPLIKRMYILTSIEKTELAKPADEHPDVTIAAETEVGAPAAYPLVQPMKAALYFDSADGFGEWRILISTRADRDLRQARNKSPKTFKIIIKKIKELSRGHFSDDNQKRLTGLNVEIPIYEAKMTGDTRLVYQVDCIPEFESDVERQVLKIFGIYTHAQLDRRFWDNMSRQLERKGAEYKKRCTYRNPPVVRGDNVVLPASWPPIAEPAPLEPASSLGDLRKEDLEEASRSHQASFYLEKFVTFSQALLNSILADQDVAHVFDVSPLEKKIIEHPSSCYVLGRSGTGKTTTMLFKMLGIERSWENYRDMMPKPRQLFVTQSRVLAEKVEEYFTKLLESLATANQSPTELAKLAARKKVQRQQGLVDRDEEIYWRGDLPKRYGTLKDEHFPMFLTYDHICRLLEAEFRYNDYEIRKQAAVSEAMKDVLELKDPAETPDAALSNDYMQQKRASFVSYGTFLEEYWSHFPQTLTKGLDPTLVFGEFMGVIKGLEQSLDYPEGYLDKETYRQLSHRTQPTFASQRENVYRLFQAYLKRKKERGDYDAADRTHALINCLKTMGVPGEEIDFMYVDEAQDNLLIDAVVLRTLCRNPHGMFWAGDTAQTISVGSAFRFNDLKAFLYRYEEATALGDVAKRNRPESFHLAINYRSHAGIVDCAYSVIELITGFWPHAIDALGQETGMVGGLKPVFFSGWDQNTVRYEQFLFGESGSHVEFGAQQCILVRDEIAREKLRAQVGDIGLILTLYESKGLEFNDVLLFNFFEDSTVDLSQWRVVLNALPPNLRTNHPAPRFDESRHSGVCRELKFLYVAITRARKNLWIADCSEKGEPMRILWTQKDLIQNCDPGTDVPKLAMSSTEEDWAKMALELFNNRRYMQAVHCYERAGLPREKAVAHAYYLREMARTTPVVKGDTAARALAYHTAAEAFLASAEDAVTEKRAYYRIAAECFVNSGDDQKGAQAYLDAGEYTLAAQHFRKAGKFNEAVAVVKAHKGQMSASVAETIVEVTKLYYLRESQLSKARELFDGDNDMLEYMDDYGLDSARALFLEQVGRYEDAAELHLSQGNTFEAIRLLTLDKENIQAVQRAMRCLLDGLWRHLPFGTVVNQALLLNDATLNKYLRLADGLIHVNADRDLRNEVSMFRAITSRDMGGLRALESAFSERGNSAAAFMCLDHVFSSPFNFATATLDEASAILFKFTEYVQKLHMFLADREICDNEVVRKIFAIQVIDEDLFLIPKDTFLSTHATTRLAPSARVIDLGVTLHRWELERLLKSELRRRLHMRVREENLAMRNFRLIQPCMSSAVYGHCNRIQCPRNHDDLKNYTAESYHSRVSVIILQILVYHELRTLEPREQLQQQRYHWLLQLYDALFPPYHKLGSYQLIDTNLTPELQRGLQVVQVWIHDFLFGLNPLRPPWPDSAFLTTLVRVARLAILIDSEAASKYLSRVPCVATFREVIYLRQSEIAYTAHDLLGLLYNSDPMALNRGILFLRHVLENKVSIDISVLCDIMESLCGSLLIASRLHNGGSLHNLTLPKSWIMRLIPSVEVLKARDTHLIDIFSPYAPMLLGQIHTGTSSLRFDGRELKDLGLGVKNVFFARICTTLCLWGYNTTRFRWATRNDIARAIYLARPAGRSSNPVIDKFLRAKSWEHLARAVRSSVSGSPLDEMIQLHHGSKPIPKSTLPNVRRVVYTRIGDISWLLKTGGSSAPLAGLRAGAAPFVPTRASAPDLQDAEGDAEDGVEEDVCEGEGEDGKAGEDEDEDARAQAVDVDDVALAIDAEQAHAAPVAPTDAEVAAARTLAQVYRQHAARAARRAAKSEEERRRRVFAAFAEHARGMAWAHAHYRLLYRGPVAHLYIVAEGLKGHLYEAKNAAKKRLNIVKHLELENVQSTLTQTTSLFKAIEKLYKALGPSADVHQTRDLEVLKSFALQVDELMRGLPPGVTEAWKEDMKLALKAIVAPKKPPKAKPKPELNVEDDLEALELVDWEQYGDD